MLIFALALILFALLAIARELHTIQSRLVEIGTIIEHFNRRDLRASNIEDVDGEDFVSESVSKKQRSWPNIVIAVVVGGVVTGMIFKALASLGW